MLTYAAYVKGIGIGGPQGGHRGQGPPTLQQAVVNKLLSITSLLVQYNWAPANKSIYSNRTVTMFIVDR